MQGESAKIARAWSAFLVLPRGDKWIGYIHASDRTGALDLACSSSGGIRTTLTPSRALTCDGDTIYVERNR